MPPDRLDLTCSMVLPAHDEADNIDTCLDAVTKAGERFFADHEIIVVDDGSTDATAERVLRRAELDPRVRLVQHATNRGYGEALRSGFATASYDLLFFTDADNQFDLDDLARFTPLIADHDVVAGYRLNRQEGWRRRAGAHAWNRLVALVFRVPFRDIDCAFKLIRRPLLDAIELRATGAMVNTELITRLVHRGARTIELGVVHLPRTVGEASGGDLRVIARAFRELVALYPSLRRP
ncbi:MAG: glycosyltransferase family 2 protein [Acidimicrobiales bacterium]